MLVAAACKARSYTCQVIWAGLCSVIKTEAMQASSNVSPSQFDACSKLMHDSTPCIVALHSWSHPDVAIISCIEGELHNTGMHSCERRQKAYRIRLQLTPACSLLSGGIIGHLQVKQTLSVLLPMTASNTTRSGCHVTVAAHDSLKHNQVWLPCQCCCP